MVCVNNLSRFPQPVELDLHQFSGSHARRDARRRRVPRHRRASLPADPGRIRVLLVPDRPACSDGRIGRMSEWTERPELSAYLARQRWCGEGEGEVAITEVRELEWLSDPDEGLGVRFELVVAGSLYSTCRSRTGAQPREDLSYGFIGAVPLDGDGVLRVRRAARPGGSRHPAVRGFVDGVDSPADIDYSAARGLLPRGRRGQRAAVRGAEQHLRDRGRRPRSSSSASSRRAATPTSRSRRRSPCWAPSRSRRCSAGSAAATSTSR